MKPSRSTCKTWTERTALHIAARATDVGALKLILDAGASTDIRNKNGSTPIDLATSSGREMAVAFLEHIDIFSDAHQSLFDEGTVEPHLRDGQARRVEHERDEPILHGSNKETGDVGECYIDDRIRRGTWPSQTSTGSVGTTRLSGRAFPDEQLYP